MMSPRRILLAVTGLSPQIVTETLYALTQRSTPWVPTEIHLISTTKGADNARLQLLSEQPGWFHRLCKDYDLPAIDFAAHHIHVIQRGDSTLLDDIRDDADNTLAADFICEKVRELTMESHSELHASIAGGRKTMGFYLGYAMSLYGRPQDRLSHVLVSEPYETQKDFFYPTPETCVIQDQRTGLALDCCNAHVWLGDIPFVRLREKLPLDLIEGRANYSQAVSEVQKALPPLQLILNPSTRQLTLGGETLMLTPVQFAHYWLFVDLAKTGKPGMHWSEDAFVSEVLHRLRQISNTFGAEYEKTEETYLRGYTKENFDPIKTKINHLITNTLGRRGEPYLLAKGDSIPGTRYRRTTLRLPPEVITVHIRPACLQGDIA